jgi:hypothetical protein
MPRRCSIDRSRVAPVTLICGRSISSAHPDLNYGGRPRKLNADQRADYLDLDHPLGADDARGITTGAVDWVPAGVLNALGRVRYFSRGPFLAASAGDFTLP